MEINRMERKWNELPRNNPTDPKIRYASWEGLVGAILMLVIGSIFYLFNWWGIGQSALTVILGIGITQLIFWKRLHKYQEGDLKDGGKRK
jgi:hypothetical protein